MMNNRKDAKELYKLVENLTDEEKETLFSVVTGMLLARKTKKPEEQLPAAGAYADQDTLAPAT